MPQASGWGEGDRINHVPPTKPLPPATASGGWEGYAPGWRVGAQPIQLTATDVTVEPTRLSSFISTRPGDDMPEILARGPADSLFVDVGLGFLVVPTAGTYALTTRLERPAASPAACLVRLGFGPHRVTSNIELGFETDFSRTFPVARFALEPGLYSIGWAFGCWHNHRITAPGRMTVLIQRPGETALTPVRPNEIVHLDISQP